MPIYEFACASCNHRFEKRRSMSAADDPMNCPACDSPEIQRLLSRVVCFTSGEGGQMTSVGGGCGGCAATSCGSCHH